MFSWSVASIAYGTDNPIVSDTADVIRDVRMFGIIASMVVECNMDMITVEGCFNKRALKALKGSVLCSSEEVSKVQLLSCEAPVKETVPRSDPKGYLLMGAWPANLLPPNVLRSLLDQEDRGNLLPLDLLDLDLTREALA